jgi:hypothetical protein
MAGIAGKPAIRYFIRRPLKNPLFVVFCLMFAVSPTSEVFSGWTFASLDSSATGFELAGPLELRFAGGTGGM